MRWFGAWILVVAAAATMVPGCNPSVEDLNAAIERAGACNPGDGCQLEGATACSCAQPVNSSQAAMIRQMADNVSCPGGPRDGGTLQCPALGNPRCVNMRCVADRF